MGSYRMSISHFFLHPSNLADLLQPRTFGVIGQWPNVCDSFDGITSAKVPTEICYDEDGMKWGFQIPESQSRFKCFKLELEPSVARTTSHLSLLFPDPKALPVDHRNNGGRLNSDYLTCLRKHVTEILKISLCAHVLETTAIEFIITVPAIWSEAAQAKVLSCAERAGMGGGTKLIREPEAAIMYAMDQELSKVEVGDIVVVCDAGGGTVDLISYMIDQLSPILEVSEAAPGSGSACGSILLNRMFAQLLHQRCGHLPGWADDTYQEALDYFENRVKRRFNGSNDRWLIPVPGLVDNEDAGIKRAKLSISGAEIRTLFDPIISTITSLVQMQINISNKTGVVKTVYLVGGFGESAYLRESLKKVVPEGIQVILPTNSWTAVVRGALIDGLAETSPLAAKVNVGSIAARKAYGILVGTDFQEGVHHHDRK
jgi:Hsp70 protein